VFHYKSIKDDSEVETALLKKVDQHPREGFWKAFWRLRLEGYTWNHKRVHRVYKNLGRCVVKQRRGVLDAHIFESLDQVREQTEIWVQDYNNFRPHDSLKNLPPTLYAQRYLSKTQQQLQIGSDKQKKRILAMS